MRYLAIILLLLANLSFAEPIIADLERGSVKINHDFTGDEILLYGYRKNPGRIIVVLRGEKKNYIIRKKEKTLGVWANKKSITFTDVDSFYFSASSDDMESIQNDSLLASLDIGANNIKLQHRNYNPELQDFKKAFINHFKDNELYFADIDKVDLSFDPLFRTKLKIPATIRRGNYVVEVYLFTNGNLVSLETLPITVQKTGLDAYIYDTAHNNKAIYGLICIFLAVFSGWLANKLFRRR